MSFYACGCVHAKPAVYPLVKTMVPTMATQGDTLKEDVLYLQPNCESCQAIGLLQTLAPYFGNKDQDIYKKKYILSVVLY